MARHGDAVQSVAFAVLGAIGRARGGRGIHPEYLHPHGRATPSPEPLAAAGLQS